MSVERLGEMGGLQRLTTQDDVGHHFDNLPDIERRPEVSG